MLIRGPGICFLALLAFAQLSPVIAQSPPPDGYVETLRWYHERAEAGDARAQFLLGVKYETGTDVRRDLTVAADWFEKAARQGHAAAQFKYAVALQTGRGRAVDHGAAQDWYRASAAQGFAPAQFNLGVLRLNSAQTEEDVAAAAALIMRAERAGLVPARDLIRRMTGIYAASILENAQRISEMPIENGTTAR